MSMKFKIEGNNDNTFKVSSTQQPVQRLSRDETVKMMDIEVEVEVEAEEIILQDEPLPQKYQHTETSKRYQRIKIQLDDPSFVFDGNQYNGKELSFYNEFVRDHDRNGGDRLLNDFENNWVMELDMHYTMRNKILVWVLRSTKGNFAFDWNEYRLVFDNPQDLMMFKLAWCI